MNTAQKLREIPKEIQYKQLLAKFKKLSKGNQFYYKIPKKELDLNTCELLLKNGFTVEHDNVNGYAVFKITW